MLQYKINHPRTKRVIDLNKISLVEFSKKTVYFDRPIYVAVALLDISKYIMADFWYNGIKKVFKEDAVLAYTDTDSLVIEFKRENTKELIETHPDLKDRFGETPGKMKVEAWLKWFKVYSPKHYDYEEINGKYKVKSKGVPKSAVKIGDKYVFDHITSKNHQIIKERVVKEIIDEDDKRIEKDGKVYAIGYFD
jgi:hypothetical protein